MLPTKIAGRCVLLADRPGHVLDPETGTVYNDPDTAGLIAGDGAAPTDPAGAGPTEPETTETASGAPSPRAKRKDLTKKPVLFTDGRRGVVTETGDEDEEFAYHVLVDGVEISADESQFRVMTVKESKAWADEVKGVVKPSAADVGAALQAALEPKPTDPAPAEPTEPETTETGGGNSGDTTPTA